MQIVNFQLNNTTTSTFN